MRCRGQLETEKREAIKKTSKWKSEFGAWRRKQDLWEMRRRDNLETEKRIGFALPSIKFHIASFELASVITFSGIHLSKLWYIYIIFIFIFIYLYMYIFIYLYLYLHNVELYIIHWCCSSIANLWPLPSSVNFLLLQIVPRHGVRVLQALMNGNRH